MFATSLSSHTRILALAALVAATAPIAPAAAPATASASANSAPGSTPNKARLAQNYGKLPLSFEANKGQANPSIQFLSRGDRYGIYLTAQEAVLTLHQPQDQAAQQANGRQTARSGHAPMALSSHMPGGADANRQPDRQPAAQSAAQAVADIVRMQLAGVNPHAQPMGEDTLPGTANYFVGRDSSQWHRNIPTFAKVRFGSVYPGVDLVYYGNQRQLEYDFIVAPGASAQPIQLHFAGATELKLDASGNLTIAAEHGQIAFHKPVLYQTAGGKRLPVQGEFKLLADNTVGFATGPYDHTKPLVIDPTLVYSTYLGGDQQDYAVSIAVDAAGEAYVTGLTWSEDFPLTPGAFESVNHATASNGVSTAFVSKLNASGTALIYSTYLGGNAIANTNFNQGDYGHSIAVDASGDAYVTGWTYSSDFPVTAGAYQTTNKAAANSEATGFVTKLSPSGTTLVYSTYLGGSTLDEPLSLTIDSSGDAYTSGFTFSSDYPTTTGAFQTANKSADYGNWNAFVTKLNPTGTKLVYSTYLGGSGENGSTVNGLYALSAVAVDKSGNAYIEGFAQSTDYPVTTTAYQTRNNAAANGGANIVLTKLNSTGTELLYSTYLGGSSGSGDFSEGIVLDSADNAYISGFTYNSDFPVTKGAFQTTNNAAQYGNSTGFAAKLNPAASGTASLVYSTFLGGSGGGDVYIPAVDASGNLYLTGSTSSTDFPITKNALQSTNGNTNAFLTELNPTGATELYSSYYGGSGEDAGLAAAVGSGGTVFLAGSTSSNDFPVTKGSFATNYIANINTAFLAKFDLGAASTEKNTTTTLVASVNPQVLKQPVKFTATVALASGTGTPAGNVVFSIDEATVATVALNTSGVATYTTSALAAGEHYVLASYAGNTTYNSSGDGLTETIVLPVAATPVIAPAAGVYPEGQIVTITDATAGATIYYTVNGTTPGTASAKYTAPFLVSSSQTVKAIATATSYTNSAVASATYNLISSPTALAIPATAIATPDATLNAVVNTFGLAGSYAFQYGTSSTALTSVTARTTLAATNGPVAVSAKLTTLKGKTTYYFQVVVTTTAGTSSGAILSFTTGTTAAIEPIMLNPDVKMVPVFAPTFSLAAGTYPKAQTVTLTSATSGAVICYSTNGVPPNSASCTRYTGPITVSKSETIDAIAVASGHVSTTSSAKYTIE
jgi:hypothetical protein